MNSLNLLTIVALLALPLSASAQRAQPESMPSTHRNAEVLEQEDQADPEEERQSSEDEDEDDESLWDEVDDYTPEERSRLDPVYEGDLGE